MAEQEIRETNKPLMLGLGAFLLSIGALVWCFVLQSHLSDATAKLASAQQENASLETKLRATDARVRATAETFGQSLGVTQRQLQARSDAILARQESDAARMEKTQAATQAKIGEVTSQVNDVKTDVGGVKTDVAATKTDLEATKTQLQRTMGDAGVMSGLIARNHDELLELKRRGERNYAEFTLRRGDKSVLLADIRLQLKKADVKHSRYTLEVNSDDKTIEKKDKNLDEPVQFYNGKTPVLYELVVNNMDKNTVSGYLSTPK